MFLYYGTLCRMLTWEDAYYDNDNPEKNCSSSSADNLHDGHSSHDPLGLAVAKMSYHVYSLGQGYETSLIFIFVYRICYTTHLFLKILTRAI